jgi:hypothetical protein
VYRQTFLAVVFLINFSEKNISLLVEGTPSVFGGYYAMVLDDETLSEFYTESKVINDDINWMHIGDGRFANILHKA